MDTITTLEIVALAFFPGFLALEALTKNRKDYKAPTGWRQRAIVVSILIFVASLGLGNLYARIFGGFHLFDGSVLGTWGGAAIGIFVYELGHYWYHRLAHRSDRLFFAGHQMHHSAESLDCYGAYYLHPIDRFFFVTIASLVFFPLLGLTPLAASIAIVFANFNGMFQHINVKTPKWLGYFIQRPEQHILHHGRDIHKYNYCDLPLIDMIFGTFKNPSTEEVKDIEGGFYFGSSSRLDEMLLGQDVTEPRKISAIRGVAQNA